MAKPKAKIKLQPDAPPAPRGGHKLIASPAPRLPDEPPPFDWRADPTCRAYACFLAYSVGWAQPPEEVTWTLDDVTGTTTVTRPASSDSPQDRVSGRRAADFGVDAIVDEIGVHWGKTVQENVRRYVWPDRPPAGASPTQDRPGRDARLLHQLANQVQADGSTRAATEKALVEVVLRCGALARAANINDVSPSAARTRNLTAAAILELLGTQGG